MIFLFLALSTLPFIYELIRTPNRLRNNVSEGRCGIYEKLPGLSKICPGRLRAETALGPSPQKMAKVSRYHLYTRELKMLSIDQWYLNGRNLFLTCFLKAPPKLSGAAKYTR
jgi:hypothetical protein